VPGSLDRNKIRTFYGSSNLKACSLFFAHWIFHGLESYRMPLQVKYMPAQPKIEKLYIVGIGIDKFAHESTISNIV
jgi:hypothetical protein